MTIEVKVALTFDQMLNEMQRGEGLESVQLVIQWCRELETKYFTNTLKKKCIFGGVIHFSK